jgi:alpha-tubulin suppressor-like RCC1 family protein
MNVRIQKECRALAPMWAAALLLVVAPLLLWPVTRDSGTVMVCAMFGFAWGVALLSVSSFGKEFAQGTYGLLLTQPVSRWSLWWEKTAVLGAALGSVAFVFVVVVLSFLPGEQTFAALSVGQFISLVLQMAGAAYGGGLCLTLLLRQANGAFWLALVLPVAVCLGAVGLAHKGWGDGVDPLGVLALALVGYSAFTYTLGLRLFLKQQDTAWLAGDVNFPLLPAWLGNRTAPAQPGRRYRRLTALLSKELHLQQASLLCTALFVMLFVAAAVVRRTEIRVLEIALHELLLGVAVLLWVMLPFLVGAGTIAEERRLGILEWQQSLPMSRRRQFLAKLLPACTLSVLLAAVLPWLIDALIYTSTGQSLTGMTEKVREATAGRALALALWATLGLPALACVLATVVGVFASSLVRNLLHAISVVFVLIVAGWGLVGLFLLTYENHWIQPGPGALLAFVGLPILLVGLGWLAYRNYCQAVPGARLWRRNLAVLGAMSAVVFGLTAALFARTWEVCLPEPRIASAHVTGPAVPTILTSYPFMILLPDGALWEWKPGNPPGRGGLERISGPGTWVEVASRHLPGKRHRNETVARKSDGSLWRWEYAWVTNAGSTNLVFARQGDPVQLGGDRGWKAIVGGGLHFLALKTDGSLWAWGKNDKGQLGDGTTEDRNEPVRVAGNTGWSQAVVGWGTSLAVKTDGTLWEWGAVRPVGSLLGLGSQQVPACTLPRRVDTGTNWARVAVSGPDTSLAIQTDGSVWKWGHYDGGRIGRQLPVVQGPTRVSDDRDWATVRWEMGQFVGLKDDGSVWTSEWPGRLLQPGQTTSFSLRSRQKPWLAARLFGSDSMVALAADGSLWSWGVFWEEESRGWLIPPSTRPRLTARLAEPKSR